MSVFHSIWTVLMFILFIGIVVWAWSRRRAGDFAAAAQIPLEDDEPEAELIPPAEDKHG
ncbi:MAG: cbb3-type cytochrome c oxidase subunit 3 [Acidiferrobacteraceae bacterium]|jgi:cytochrome c oxidase cbb3-type subunit 4|nr:cbb3-type cytochrome c oxidase subunit 3 [Acidiferrobacteraceae bacterium]HIE76651.1 cbb3-type cytochrome c oxidase subunit 3 [Gammaproteobacteria bacterium]